MKFVCPGSRGLPPSALVLVFGPGGLAPFQKGGHPLLGLVASEELRREAGGVLERLLLLHGWDFIDESFGKPHGGGTAFAEIGKHLLHCGVQFASGDRAVDQSELRGSPSGEAIAAKEGLHGFAGAHLRQANH